MCEPVSMTMLALSVAGTAASFAAQQQQASAQSSYENKQYAATGQAALTNYNQQTGAQGGRLIQNDAQAAQAQYQNAVNGMQARAHANTSAVEAGVGGNSVQDLLNDFTRVEATNADTIRTNNQWATQQSTQDERALQSQAQNRITAALPAPVQYPSIAGSLVQMGASSLSAYDTYQQRDMQGVYNPLYRRQMYQSRMNGFS